MADRIKQGFYLHPDDPADVKCREVIESVSQRVRGDFIRQAVIAGCALHTLDPRLPKLLSTLFDGSLSDEQLIAMVRQVSGWKPSEADIGEVVKAAISVSGGAAAPAEEIADTKAEAESSGAPNKVRANMNSMFGKKE
ncbi:plasmid partitioning/stability family protein [Candidatus Pantoea multigeneris]|uniref:Plasmid stability protein n=1 Tax=Candidatus Pantoea multigeneris TaxID=2608357 RepID=A0ABX0RG45_9GAMM|nr:plasmid partitioning/stability family protein [Pantoea multigeneris]NIF24027.1 plasmid stability protein [Pantoea multigeneris]